jgi:acyl-CoA synthetase (AMP-forming)/AMP-acid ligase II
MGNVVAFSVQEDTGEYLVMVAETRAENRGLQIAQEIRSRMADTVGVKPDEVLVVPPGTLPKTSSGKLKRNETRELYLSGNILQKKSLFADLGAALQTGLAYLRGLTRK